MWSPFRSPDAPIASCVADNRAITREGIIYRKVFDADREYFEDQVDYVIRPTI